MRFAAGNINTSGLLSPLYGFYEARLDTLPGGDGMLSAWWLWPENGLWNYDYPKNV